VWSERVSSSSICIIAVLISKLCVCAQAQQLQGRFYSEADSYIVGGPVLFNLEIKNTGRRRVLAREESERSFGHLRVLRSATNSAACGANWNAEYAMRRLH
jgi:hypothetical protein